MCGATRGVHASEQENCALGAYIEARIGPEAKKALGHPQRWAGGGAVLQRTEKGIFKFPLVRWRDRTTRPRGRLGDGNFLGLWENEKKNATGLRRCQEALLEQEKDTGKNCNAPLLEWPHFWGNKISATHERNYYRPHRSASRMAELNKKAGPIKREQASNSKNS